MNKLYDIIRLIMTSKLSNGDIASVLNVAKNTVRRYRNITVEKHYEWEALSQLDGQQLDAAFNVNWRRQPKKRMTDFAVIHHELQAKNVTLQLLWEEYRLPSPDDALSYSQFTHHYREFCSKIKLSMRQQHHPGERAFVDFSGMRPHYINRDTGERIFVELFVGVLGYSHYPYATAVRSQKLMDWILANVQMLEHFGGVPQIIVPDNLKSAVTTPGREPLLNRTYEDMARHYGSVILPARSRHPKDKATVEGCVKIVQRWILAKLRHSTFFSLEELNMAIAELLKEMSSRPFKRLPGCRQERFDQYDKPALQPLPKERYELAEWVGPQKIGADYHVVVMKHAYSVPYQLVGSFVDARVTAARVELFYNFQRVASHARSDEVGGHTTNLGHMPESHRSYANRTPESFIAWARSIGPSLLAVVEHQFDRQFPTLGLPACDSLQRLARRHGNEQIELAAKRAIEIKSLTVKSVKSLLSVLAYTKAHAEQPVQGSLPLHHNVRGAHYFSGSGQGGSSC